MIIIHDTISLCNECYRHIPAIVYEQDDVIKISKDCQHHGKQEAIVEVDKEFYYGLKHHHYVKSFNQVLFEASDRCQLNCPHCYHLPDNKIQDRSIDSVIYQLKQFPTDCSPMLAGAEATLRPDFIELCSEMSKLNFEHLEVLSNGLKFANEKWTSDVYDAGVTEMCFGLNHPSYQGEAVHNKQLRALDILKESSFEIGYVGYTIESYDHLPFILNEIKSIDHPSINHYRIRCGSFIGRSNDQHRSYLSNLVKEIKRLTNNEVVTYPSDDNPYHVMLNWNGIILRLIQWPDVTNIDMEELVTGPWCQFYDGPITNFVHQAITRDAFKNMNKPMLDEAPEKYQYRSMSADTYSHWKDNWTRT